MLLRTKRILLFLFIVIWFCALHSIMKKEKVEKSYFNVSHKAKLTRLPKCTVSVKNELRKLFLNPQYHQEKLIRIKQENNPKFSGQQTCEQICNLLTVPKTMDLKQNGNLSDSEIMSDMYQIVESNKPNIKSGAWTYKTQDANCKHQANRGVAVIIAFRERWMQLVNTLSTLIKLLKRQKLCYRIFVIEQDGTELFNRGMIFNVGFMEAMNRFNFECVVFHDADLVPINDLNPYGCDNATLKNPIHLGVGLDTRNFKLNYARLIGGVLKMTNKHFVTVNGHSNLYWGWGQEDDDLERRLTSKKIKYIQMPTSIARYKAVSHIAQKKKPQNRKVHLHLLKQAVNRLEFDGLSTLKYEVLNVINHELFTHILVNLGQIPEMYKCQ